MKGFIEVTSQDSGDKFGVSINLIGFYRDNWIVINYFTENATGVAVTESYEQIKELIKQAQ